MDYPFPDCKRIIKFCLVKGTTCRHRTLSGMVPASCVICPVSEL